MINKETEEKLLERQTLRLRLINARFALAAVNLEYQKLLESKQRIEKEVEEIFQEQEKIEEWLLEKEAEALKLFNK